MFIILYAIAQSMEKEISDPFWIIYMNRGGDLRTVPIDRETATKEVVSDTSRFVSREITKP